VIPMLLLQQNWFQIQSETTSCKEGGKEKKYGSKHKNNKQLPKIKRKTQKNRFAAMLPFLTILHGCKHLIGHQNYESTTRPLFVALVVVISDFVALFFLIIDFHFALKME
jgi:hypothetical protein